MPNPSIDSLSGPQRSPDSPAPVAPPLTSPLGSFSTAPDPVPVLPPSEAGNNHVEIPPIGPASGVEGGMLGGSSSDRFPTMATSPDAGSPLTAQRATATDPIISSAVASPVVETHKGSVPIAPMPATQPTQAEPLSVPKTAAPWGQRPAYLWLLLAVGLVFLLLLVVVYFGGIYKSS